MEKVIVVESKGCAFTFTFSDSTTFTEGEKSPNMTAIMANFTIKDLLFFMTTPSLPVLQYRS
jgi:hypothetical protein